MGRPSKEEYYLGIARQISERSTCLRAKGGAIIVKDDQIVATGYNGAPRKTKSCLDRNECLRDKLNISHGTRYEMCRSVHAEQNAIINAARAGVSILGGDMYIYFRDRNGNNINSLPCFICKKMIINCGLKRVICSMRDENIKIFKVEDWVREWQEKDIIDDKHQYGTDLNINEKYLKQ
ncbi:MAG: dCMP deaminase family protein [Candidatus Aenigmarchaeota archaeon]|nr:dCMP deaminase family protein [Candidatus Aenigmarchaeota archaeon]